MRSLTSHHIHLFTSLVAILIFPLVANGEEATTSSTSTEEYDGIVVAARVAEISPRSDGLLDKIHFRPGQIVRKDDLLFEFNPTEKQLMLDASVAKRKRAEVQLRSAELELKRNAPLRKKNVISEEEYLKHQIARDTAVVNLEEARVAERGAQIGLRSTKLYAPFTGLVSRPLVNEGAYITQEARDQASLAQVTQFDPVFVRYDVPYAIYQERWPKLSESLDKASERVECTLTFPTGKEFPHTGHLIGGGNEFEPETQTVAVWAEFPNPDQSLRPGLKVKVRSRLLPANPDTP